MLVAGGWVFCTVNVVLRTNHQLDQLQLVAINEREGLCNTLDLSEKIHIRKGPYVQFLRTGPVVFGPGRVDAHREG